MAKWKRQKERQQSRVSFLRFDDDETKDLVVSDWDFQKGSSGSLFKCYITAENGEDVDKVWYVWDYNFVQKLKKRLGVKYIAGEKKIKVTMHKDDEDEIYFELH